MTERLRRDGLLAAIAEQEALLARLASNRERARIRLADLRTALTALGPEPAWFDAPVHPQTSVPTTPAEKVALFRQLFRGRSDVFPRLWTNPRKGTKGYALACHNEWLRGVCEKPRVRCSECPNQAFIAVDDQVILDHLYGRCVIGVYPLLEDETCWLLAVDFDGDSWRDDAAAFVQTCRSISVPVAIERSRSGNGAHAWFFFNAPVPASLARTMGCFLITETMAHHHQLGMQSYDRLFPSQDTLPRGGLGNLIALPLQRAARKQGHTLFIGDDLEPLPNQWEYLASIRRMDPESVEEIAQEAARRGQVVGVQMAEPVDEHGSAPWMRSPSGRSAPMPMPGPLPTKVCAVVAQRIFVEKAGLPSPLLNRIKRLAAFQNPEFYARQRMRLSTATTPRVVACAEDLPRHIALPRGCRTELERLLAEYGISLAVDDQREAGQPIDISFLGELTPDQNRAARAVLEHDQGVFVAPPGTGKTVLGAYLIAQRARSSLVLVHRKPLLDQWVAQLAMFLGVHEKDIGQIGGGKRRPNGRLDVAMIQSLVRNGNVDDIVASYGHVLVDECHHVPAVSFERVLGEVKARYLAGLTATPQRRDGHDPILAMQLGPVRFSLSPKDPTARQPFTHSLVVRETTFRSDPVVERDLGIQEIYRALASDEQRNRLILDDVIQAVAEGRSPILLTERRDHLDYFADRLRGFVRHLIVLQGGMRTKERRRPGEKLAEVPEDEERLVLATGRYIGEGFDDARFDTLFLALPISWKGTLVQYSGRLHRLHPRKTEVRIYDYVDPEIPMLARMFEKRLRTYRAMGYALAELPIPSVAPLVEPIIEYDQEALRRVTDGA